jgi:hypothetical protein
VEQPPSECVPDRQMPGYLMMNERPLEGPPAGAGLKTVTEAVCAVVMSLAGM